MLTVVLWLIILGGMGYLLLILVVPQWLAGQITDASEGRLTIRQITVQIPLSLVFSGVEIATEPGIRLSSERVVLTPRGVSWAERLIRFKTLELYHPHLQCQRLSSGAVRWPDVSIISQTIQRALGPSHAPSVLASSPTGWRVRLDTVRVVDGILDYVDEHAPQPFRGALTNVSVVGGPVIMPVVDQPVSLAIQTTLVGHAQHTATLYCSGWVNAPRRDVNMSCQMDPLRLAAFDPYYKGSWQVRVYNATLKLSGTLVSKNNALEGRAQMEIGNLSDADLSMLGDATHRADAVLTGEVQWSGPLDQPAQWSWQLVPGNDIVQRLLRPLLNRGLRIRVGTQTIPVGLTPADELTMSAIEAGKKQVEENLRIIAPAPVEGSAVTPEASATPTPTPTPSAEPTPTPSPLEPSPPVETPASSMPKSSSQAPAEAPGGAPASVTPTPSATPVAPSSAGP